MFAATHLVGFGAGGEPAVTYAYLGQTSTTTTQTTNTFSSLALGTAAASRKIVVVACNESSAGTTQRTLSSATVNGETASSVVAVNGGGDPNKTVYIIEAEVPTGTSGDIVITWSGDTTVTSIAWFAVYGAGSAHDTGSSTANPLNDSLDIPTGGIALAVAQSSSGASITFSWTNLTEDHDTVVKSGYSHSSASASFAAAQTGLSITATPSTGGQQAMALVSYGPG